MPAPVAALVIRRIALTTGARSVPLVVPMAASAMRVTMRAIIAIITAMIVIPPIIRALTIIAGLRWLPDNRGHILLAGPRRFAGPGHGAVRIAPPLAGVRINLRGHKNRAVILLRRRRWRHYRSNNVARLRVAILGCNASVVIAVVFHLPGAGKSVARLPLRGGGGIRGNARRMV